jgi:protein-tyrosine phosphatase
MEMSRASDPNLSAAFHLSVVCTGNICRSPIGEVIYRRDLQVPNVAVSSAGTARWHVGSPMDSRARRALQRAGYDDEGTLGAYADRTYLERVDLVVAMTRAHRDDLMQTQPGTKVVLVRELLGEGELDVADPYYGDDADFDAVVVAIQRSVPTLQALLTRGDLEAVHREA